jgi:hypothetical protein
MTEIFVIHKGISMYCFQTYHPELYRHSSKANQNLKLVENIHNSRSDIFRSNSDIEITENASQANTWDLISILYEKKYCQNDESL